MPGLANTETRIASKLESLRRHLAGVLAEEAVAAAALAEAERRREIVAEAERECTARCLRIPADLRWRAELAGRVVDRARRELRATHRAVVGILEEARGTVLHAEQFLAPAGAREDRWPTSTNACAH